MKVLVMAGFTQTRKATVFVTGDEREFDIGVLCTSRLPVVETIK
jgi:hypothetical protein